MADDTACKVQLFEGEEFVLIRQIGEWIAGIPAKIDSKTWGSLAHNLEINSLMPEVSI